MNQHSIPTDIHRRLGLDNVEPSGLEVDRPVADVASEAGEAAKKPHESLEPLEAPICELVRNALIAATMAHSIERRAITMRKASVSGEHVLNALDDELSALYVLVDDLRDDTKALRDLFYASWNEVVK